MSVETEVQARLGQALAAFGQGTGAIRIARATVTLFYDTFRPPFQRLIESRPDAFEAKAGYVLDVFRTLGALSQQLARSGGASTIDPGYFQQAFAAVQAAEQAKNDGIQTDFCLGASMKTQ
jgi:hypothetical protein